ncbi:unnamed protein product, partial [Staurois parvus]
TDISPVSSCTLLCAYTHNSHPKQCAYSEAHGHIQHTVNPLIGPHANPFLPGDISTASVLFFSTDHCIGVIGDVSDTKSVPPSARMSSAVLP